MGRGRHVVKRVFRGLDLNQRPLGYEPTPGPDCNRLLPIKAAETRASPSPPLGSDRRLLEGVPAQFPHNRGSLVSSRRVTSHEAIEWYVKVGLFANVPLKSLNIQ